MIKDSATAIVEFDRAVQIRDRSFVVAKIVMQAATIAVRLKEIFLQRNRPIEIFQSACDLRWRVVLPRDSDKRWVARV